MEVAYGTGGHVIGDTTAALLLQSILGAVRNELVLTVMLVNTP